MRQGCAKCATVRSKERTIIPFGCDFFVSAAIDDFNDTCVLRAGRFWHIIGPNDAGERSSEVSRPCSEQAVGVSLWT